MMSSMPVFAALACSNSFIISAFSRIVVHISRPPSESRYLAVVAYFSHTSLVIKGGSMTCGASQSSAAQKELLMTDHHVKCLQTL
jgi:hypothetical protein